MDHAASPDRDLTRRSIERELDLVSVAISMVASHVAPSVTLAGLDFGPDVLASSEAKARPRGVLLEPLWRPDDSGCDIRVRGLAPWDERG
ncbi:MAG: hypothetical protein ACRDGI_03965 [Candidatus Limnocylindrales bacterium]